MENKIGVIPITLYKIIEGRKYQFIGVYPKDDNFISDLKRTHQRHGFVIEVTPYEYQNVKLWRRRK